MTMVQHGFYVITSLYWYFHFSTNASFEPLCRPHFPTQNMTACMVGIEGLCYLRHTEIFLENGTEPSLLCMPSVATRDAILVVGKA